jgi:hypothetical protein
MVAEMVFQSETITHRLGLSGCDAHILQCPELHPSDFNSKFWNEHGSVLLPLLVIFAIAILPIILFLAQWNTTDLQ